MSEAQKNPYVDESLLMEAYLNYSPTENNQYLKDHGASKQTQNIVNNNQATVVTQPLPNYQNDAQSQVCSTILFLSFHYFRPILFLCVSLSVTSTNHYLIRQTQSSFFYFVFFSIISVLLLLSTFLHTILT